jgi:hypothetical protein
MVNLNVIGNVNDIIQVTTPIFSWRNEENYERLQESVSGFEVQI